MSRHLLEGVPAVLAAVILAIGLSSVAETQKRAGILRMYSLDSPANMSIMEAPTVYAKGPMMGVFNNLILFD